MKRSVILEALIVGLINLVMFVSIRGLLPKVHIFTQLVLTGALIHLFFEYSPFGNLNEKWCRATFPKAAS
jgi:hypothetical protein